MFPSLLAKLNHWDDNPVNAFTGKPVSLAQRLINPVIA